MFVFLRASILKQWLITERQATAAFSVSPAGAGSTSKNLLTKIFYWGPRRKLHSARQSIFGGGGGARANARPARPARDHSVFRCRGLTKGCQAHARSIAAWLRIFCG